MGHLIKNEKNTFWYYSRRFLDVNSEQFTAESRNLSMSKKRWL